jgi:predicted nucleic acid-binding protein
MAAKPLFIDSGGFYALMSAADPAHERAVGIMKEASQTQQRIITTDYVIDETATLLLFRGLTKPLTQFFLATDETKALTIEWVSPERFSVARKFMLKHIDQRFSFTDCVSFIVMRELGLTDALATDSHFRVAGFNPLLVA